jgi:hypothetical protein
MISVVVLVGLKASQAMKAGPRRLPKPRDERIQRPKSVEWLITLRRGGDPRRYYRQRVDTGSLHAAYVRMV